jgi:hypothetical protein
MPEKRKRRAAKDIPTKSPAPKGNWKTRLVDQLSWKKLRRYELTNLAWSCIALFFTVKFAVHQSNPLYPSILLVVIVAGTFGCVMWACKQ